MTKLERLFKDIQKENKRIEMLKNTIPNGDYDFFDWIKKETKISKSKIKTLQKEFDEEYEYQNT